jgi:anti-sigma factor RsiW
MSSRVIAFDPDGHVGVQSLLPWYANSRLDAAESALVEAHLAGCAECRAELEWERRMFVAQSDVHEAASDPEPGLARLHQQIAQAHTDTPRRTASPAGGWLRWVLVAQSVAIAYLGMLWILPSNTAAPSVGYRALGNPAHAAGANAVVRFHPEAPERAIRQALSNAGARLVDGPTVSDAYLLMLPSGDVARQLAILRADPSVALAESLDSAAPR